jgi:serine/threonine-protein kinase
MNRIGKYELIAPLGQGGSAHVFRAYDPRVARPVAIKLLGDCVDSKQLGRLQAEARAAGRLQHRNIVSIFGLEIEDGHPYLVMELLEGQALSDCVPPDTPMAIRQAVEIMHQVAQGLEHAHANGVVHRDVSPQNILVLPDGTAKLIDFEIAGGFQGGRTMTDGDRPLGTVLFFSPEHLSDTPVKLDPRSDIFSYGSVFYQLVAGKHPFAGQDDRETICNILMHDPEPLARLRPGCPPALSQLVQRALLKDLDLRYQGFGDLLTDLYPVLMDLRRAEASGLFKAARQVLEEDRPELATSTLSRILELVPDHKEARELLETLQGQKHESVVRAKVQTFLEEAEQKLQQRKFREAVSILEKARRLEPASGDVSKRLEEARSARERNERCLALIGRAEEQSRGGNLKAALITATEAARLDPENADAARLSAWIRGIAEADAKQKLREGLAHARELLKQEQFVASEAVLGSLLEQFPDAADLRLLLGYARSESTLRNRKRVIEEARKEAIRRAAFGEYALAIEAIQRALEQYPDDPELTLLMAATQADDSESGGQAASAPGQREGDSSGKTCACGNLLRQGAKFCDGCGKPVGLSPQAPT